MTEIQLAGDVVKIESISAHQPETPGAPQDWRTQLGQIVVEITTSSGLVGIGVGGGGKAGIHIVETVLRDLLIGQDPADVESLHAAMLQHTVFYGRKGLVVMAISGVDLALWDLRGKIQGTSIARWLNPQVDLERSLPTYCTVFEPDDAEEAIAAGHQAIKLHVERFGDRPEPTAIANHVSEIRRRLGDRASLMIDAFGRWDVDSSLAVARAVADHRIDWLEEPIRPDDRAGYQKLMRESPVPIAGGEHEYTAGGFQDLVDQQLHAVLQPDINWCGGMTTLLEVYRIARDAGLQVCPHRGCEPFALAAIAAVDPQPLAESGRTWFRCLQGAPSIVEGRITPSAAPGFGVELAP